MMRKINSLWGAGLRKVARIKIQCRKTRKEGAKNSNSNFGVLILGNLRLRIQQNYQALFKMHMKYLM
jgi:hypothetical protein